MERSAFHRPRPLSVYLEKSSSVALLMEQLAKAMAEFQPIVKDAKGRVIRRIGGRDVEVEYRYATLDSLHRATKPALLKHGVVPRQDYGISDEGVTLVTTLHYGDEFVCSTLPIRQFEDQQRQKAHMSYMRRTAYEGILCLSAEDDADGAEESLPSGHEAAAPSDNGKAPVNRMWQRQEELAAKAIEDGSTVAQVEDVLAKVRGKITAMDMDPHSLGRLEGSAKKRIEVLSKAKKQEVAK